MSLDSLLKAGSMFDFGILVATKDDKTKSRDKGFETPRDNVIFEFGLFMGRLGEFWNLGPSGERRRPPVTWQGSPSVTVRFGRRERYRQRR